MIKALFFDLDGTLLTSSKKILPSTKYAIEKCMEQGIRVFVATARPPLLNSMLRFTYEEEKLLADGGVYYNGACLFYGNIKRYTTIVPESVAKVREIISSYPEINLVLQMEDEKHSFRYELSDIEYRTWGISVKDIIDYKKISPFQTVKMVIFIADLSNLSCKLPKELYSEICSAVSSNTNVYLTDKGKSIQIISQKANKKLGIEQILKTYEIELSEAAVFGDDYSDMEMLQGFKNSIAMGNACEQIKAIAKYITSSNDEDGIFNAIKDYLYLI